MKHTLTIIFLFCLSHYNVNAQVDSNEPVVYNECANVETFDATFKGGIEKFRKWLSREILKLELDINEVNASIIFVVNTDGTLSNIEIKQLNNPQLQNQLMEIMTRSPRWLPKKESVNGYIKNYRQRFKVPISIVLK